MSASCTECRTLLGGYVLHALEPDEQASVERHLATCVACAAERAHLAAVPAVLDAAGPVEPAIEQPPPALEEAVLDRFAREHPSPSRRAAPAPRRRRPRFDLRRPLTAAVAGALAAAAVTAALLVLPGSGGNGHGGNGGEWYEANLAGDGGATASADLRVHPSGTRVKLNVEGLRGTPGAVYELWCLKEDGTKVSAGTFRTDSSGHADVSLTTAAVPGEYHRMSIERRAYSPGNAAGERVMAGEIEYPHS